MIENNVFECILDTQFRFNYDKNYSFQIEYKTDTPLKMTVFSEIECTEFKSSKIIDDVSELMKYCNWFEYSPLNCDAKMLKNWRQRKKQMLEFVKYIGDEGTQSDEEDDNFSMKRESTSVELNDIIKQCYDNYQTFLNLNDDKLSYCLYDFLLLNQTKIERDKLWKIFDEVEELKLLHINVGIIEIIGSYIAVIYARAADSAYVHFSYGGILPNKHIYENVTFRRRDKKIRVTNNRNRLYGEVVYIFQKYHCDPTMITESMYSELDVVIYYEEHGIYSITQIDDNANSVEFVDLKLHRDFIKTQLM